MSDNRIESPIGRTFVASSGEPRRFVVEDESQERNFSTPSQPSIESQFSAAREEKRSGGRISPAAKHRIELLTGITRLTREVKVGDTVFSIRTLKHGEMREAISVAANETPIRAAYEAKKQQLARSIFKINNFDIDQLLGGRDIELSLEMVEEFDEVLLNVLYDQYRELNEEATAKFGIKSAKEAADVVNDLKK